MTEGGAAVVQSLEPSLAGYTLTDRYLLQEGRVFLSGVQALARLPLEQLRVDRAAGLRTAAFISGYPGSPLGGFDQEAARAAKQAPELPVVCRPAVNEELGATAVMGSQLAAEQPDCRYDGIVGVWYGKAPGLDRAGDALRHAVFAGTSRHGGAVALVGDDPAAKSSTLPSSSDATLVDLHMPILYPGDVQEALDLGRHAIALSRASGLWTAMKIVAAVADGTGTVELSPDRVRPVIPTMEVDGKPYVCHPDGRLLTPHTLDIEREFREVRTVLAMQYSVDNDLNRVTVDPPDAWIGLVATGYTYHELLEALRRLGLNGPQAIHDAGIRLLEMRMPVPFHRDTVRRFAHGLSEIVVVEEKNPTLEWLVKDALYDNDERPLVLGKTHPDGRPLMPSSGILDADAMLGGLRDRLSARLSERLAPPPAPERDKIMIPLGVTRSPYFCSGCPHNWGTKVPEGTLVGAGIGCHGMTLLMDTERVGETMGITAMGNEGTQWIGMAPFVERGHVVQNLGDGTFFHSGQLAIQAAVAAGVTMTFKLLFNGTVAMTGGQDAVGGVGVPEIATILLAHGVADVLITTEDLEDYRGVELPDGPDGPVQVWDRTRIVEAQERLAAKPGVTVLIHDQACAAQNRRLRKRGQAATPGFRVVINHRICEGCGDCGEVSNCLSVQPLDTPLGRKTTIDQSSCNLDFSCLHGDCPSFMTVEAAPGPSRAAKVRAALPFGRRNGRPEPRTDLPAPQPIVPTDRLAVRFTGIGGTGVVTISQILGTAAMLDGWDVRGLDQTGLSQKAGPVVSDLRLSRTGPSPSNLLGTGEADVIIAFDALVAAGDKFLQAASPDRTVVVASSTRTPTGSMVGHPELDLPEDTLLQARLGARSRADANRWVDAGAITGSLLGDAAAANVFLLGVAVQAGCVPVDPVDIEEAIDLNGVAVEQNLTAFRWGRNWAHDPVEVEALAGLDPRTPVDVEVPDLPPHLAARVVGLGRGPDGEALVELWTMLAADLCAYQDAVLAESFLDSVAEVDRAEARVDPESTRLTATVGRMLHKLLAYKDEYEVARLMVSPEATAAVEAVGGPGAKASWRLHPPLLKRCGLDHKIELGPWTAPAFKALQRGKRLRGTPLDPFGRTPLRRAERRLPEEYRAAVERLVAGLAADNLDEAVAIAALPDHVRGYEALKERRIDEYRSDLALRLSRYEAG
jgi:indolepyruvate ferredoxin oxidoreductase